MTDNIETKLTKRSVGQPPIHGGEGAVESIEAGVKMMGLAAIEEAKVREEWEQNGELPFMVENAGRLQTAARLYWNAVQSILTNEKLSSADIDRLTGYVARFGWLSNSSMRAWERVIKHIPKDKRKAVNYEEMLEMARRQQEEAKKDAE